MATRSRALVIRTTLPAGAWTDVYTVPADRTLIVHAFALENRTSAAKEVAFGVRRGSATVAVARNAALGTGGVLANLNMDMQLSPGDVVVAFNGSESTATGVGCYVAGSLLAGAPA